MTQCAYQHTGSDQRRGSQKISQDPIAEKINRNDCKEQYSHLGPSSPEPPQPEDDRPLILLDNLETDTEGEGEGEDDQEEGDGGEDQATQADPSLIFF